MTTLLALGLVIFAALLLLIWTFIKRKSPIVFREIAAPERLVATELFDNPWYEGEAVDTTVLVEEAGRTTMTLTVLYASKKVRDAVLETPAESGVEYQYDRLAEMLAAMATRELR